MTTETASVKGQFSDLLLSNYSLPCFILTPVSLLKNELNLPKEVRHMIYIEPLWGK